MPLYTCFLYLWSINSFCAAIRLSKRDDTPQNSPLLSSRLAHQSSSSNVFFRLTTSNPSSSEGNSRCDFCSDFCLEISCTLEYSTKLFLCAFIFLPHACCFVLYYNSKGQVKKLKFSGRNKLLVCTHSAEGHTNCVLSVYATNQLLFSASQGK